MVSVGVCLFCQMLEGIQITIIRFTHAQLGLAHASTVLLEGQCRQHSAINLFQGYLANQLGGYSCIIL